MSRQAVRRLRVEAGSRQLVLEIHEQSSTERSTFTAFRDGLKSLGIGLAYDDFGVGQTRLRELAEFPPDYLKFDRSLVKDLGSPQSVHGNLVRSLHEHARELGIATVAEGLDQPTAAEACRQMGFTHYEGFLFGHPVTVDQLRGDTSIV